jgi:predicted amidohydrolase
MTTRIALAQLSCIEGDAAANAAAAREAIETAGRQAADFIILPELHLTGFVGAGELPGVAEPWPGSTVGGLVRDAAARGLGLCTSFVETGPGDRPYNTAVLSDRAGRILTGYRKAHLFDAERPLYAPGDALPAPVDADGLLVGMLICYDIEFPEAARQVSLAAAQCLFVPSANMEPWGERHRVFCLARALENHVFVAYCNRCGDGPGLHYAGGSMIVDPMGRVLCEAGDTATVICADVDTAVIAGSTEVFSYLRERRPELYSSL